MKKILLRKYDDGEIRFYKTFKEERALLDFANDIRNEQSQVQGPVETDDKIIYTLNLKWSFENKSKIIKINPQA